MKLDLNKFLLSILSVVLLLAIPLSIGCMPENNDTEKMVVLSNWVATSGVPNNAITVNAEDKNTTFICTVDSGEFWNYTAQEYCKQVKLSCNETTWWHGDGIEKDFVSVIAKNGDYVAGYAAVGIEQNDGADYSATVLKVVWFDEYKSFEQVQQLLKEVKNIYISGK